MGGRYDGPEFAGQRSFEAADDLGLHPALGGPDDRTGLGLLVTLQVNDYGAIERRASLPVTTAIDPVAGGHLR